MGRVKLHIYYLLSSSTFLETARHHHGICPVRCGPLCSWAVRMGFHDANAGRLSHDVNATLSN